MEKYSHMQREELLAEKELVKRRLAEFSTPALTSTENVHGPEKLLTHWDYVMKEMGWLAADFQKERSRHMVNARKVSRAVDVFHKTKEARDLKKEKDEILALKRVSSKISRDVRKFWLKINKVIAFKQKAESDDIRQKAMDKHLVFLVKQTERYTNMLANNMLQAGGANSSESDNDNDEDDRESTAGGRRSSSAARSMKYGGTTSDYLSAADESEIASAFGVDENEEEDDDGDDEFIGDEDEQDDETTLLEQEALEAANNLQSEGEVALLEKDRDIPIEELRAMYAGMADTNNSSDDNNSHHSDSNSNNSNNESPNTDYDGAASSSIGQSSSRSIVNRKDSSSSSSSSSNSDNNRSSALRNVQIKHDHVQGHGHASYRGEDNCADDDEDEDGEGCNDKDDEDDDNDEDDDDGEFVGDDEQDDETTLLEQEQLEAAGGSTAADDELAELQKDGEIPIEQLRAMYAGMEEEAFSDEEEDDIEDKEDADRTGDDDADSKAGSGAARIGASAIRSRGLAHNDGEGCNDKDDEDDDDEDDGEFVGDDEQDDETTLLEQEQLEAAGGSTAAADELAELQKDGEIPIEQLRAMYAGMEEEAFSDEEEDDSEDNEDARDPESEDESGAMVLADDDTLDDRDMHKQSDDDDSADDEDDDNDEDDDGEFVGDDEQDDETTLLEQEQLEAAGGSTAAADELAELQKDGEIPIEQLRAMYAGMEEAISDEEEDDSEDNDAINNTHSVADNSSIEKDNNDNSEKSEALKVEDEDVLTIAKSSDAKHTDEEDNVNDAIKRLEAADLAARSVHIERPYVLTESLKLREYQNIGLNWLVSLHERRLNGILADEMGLGKTVQTISLLAHLATYKGIWGPHLIVVPTSVILNWEIEFKKFCPVFKILTYFGGTKARKALRTGWSRLNSFHVCITSYQLIVQDANAFRRKQWYYMVLDEAHNIKNFKSKRWQTLLNFNTQRRLLLTGTPLQNNLMELWSLMHFLMPHIFRSRKEFSYWFSNPLTGMVEGNRGINNDLISRLHSIMRPFLLRRLKKDVAKQLPGKFEHIVGCKLSKRQQHLYEEYMSRTTTRASLTGGNYLGMMNILMQLRKVCNHPDLFEPRPIQSPCTLDSVVYRTHSLFTTVLRKPIMDVLSSTVTHFWNDPNVDPLSKSRVSELKIGHFDFVTMDDISLNSTYPDRYTRFAENLHALLKQQRDDRNERNFKISDARCTPDCDSILAVSWRVIKAVETATKIDSFVKARYDPYLARELPDCMADMVLTPAERMDAMLEIITRFVFVIPPVKSVGVTMVSNTVMRENNDIKRAKWWVKTRVERELAPFYPAAIRQKIVFPDRKLVQFDSGKLQTLAVLLRDLKKGGHKCLIFTQMSKMLDVLEIFLNLNNHTFVRLDGSTGIERRQKLMDRFNADPKLFCFILSTRSGGLGINLTGADTVIFYDTDWNPAMDAQAQDRAHRIGQTREVHIYRLINTGTVEENILLKARQKQHLDFLVMTEGNFTESSLSLLSAKGIKDVLGAPAVDGDSTADGNGGEENDESKSKREIELAMQAAEDIDDINAMNNLKAEVAKEQDEFDENAQTEANLDGDDDNDVPAAAANGISDSGAAVAAGTIRKTASSSSLKNDGKQYGATAAGGGASATDLTSSKTAESIEEGDMEKEFASWQQKVGPDFDALQSALRPIEKYALRFRTDIDPFYSMFYLSDQARMQDVIAAEEAQQWDIDEIEKEKEEEEQRLLHSGELVFTNVGSWQISRLRRLYEHERAKRKSEGKRKLQTGECWIYREDPLTLRPFWYNEVTGVISYSIPKIIANQIALEDAMAGGYGSLPVPLVVLIFSYLQPFPERCNCSSVCSSWNKAAWHPSFLHHVLPVERHSSKLAAKVVEEDEKYPHTHKSIKDALSHCLPGDTIVLGPGHHWEGQIDIRLPVRIVSQHQDGYEKCIVEISQQVRVYPSARSVILNGLTIRHPRKMESRMACVFLCGAQLGVYNCLLSNEGASGSVIYGSNNARVNVYASTLTHGTSGVIAVGSTVCIAQSMITENKLCGVKALDCEVSIADTFIVDNGNYAISILGLSNRVYLTHCGLMCSPFDGDVLQEDPRRLFDFNEDRTPAILTPKVAENQSDSIALLDVAVENNSLEPKATPVPLQTKSNIVDDFSDSVVRARNCCVYSEFDSSNTTELGISTIPQISPRARPTSSLGFTSSLSSSASSSKTLQERRQQEFERELASFSTWPSIYSKGRGKLSNSTSSNRMAGKDITSTTDTNKSRGGKRQRTDNGEQDLLVAGDANVAVTTIAGDDTLAAAVSEDVKLIPSPTIKREEASPTPISAGNEDTGDATSPMKRPLSSIDDTDNGNIAVGGSNNADAILDDDAAANSDEPKRRRVKVEEKTDDDEQIESINTQIVEHGAAEE